MRIRSLFAPILIALFALAAACGGTTPAVQDQITDGACPEAMAWDQAIQNVGERATVQGPVVGTRYASGSNGQPTFLNVGKDYPDRDRFTVVI